MVYDDTMKIEPGQIWEVNVSGGRTGKIVVVACQRNFANTLSIWDSDIQDNMPLIAGGCVDTRRMAYTVYDNFRCLIDTVSGSELEQIKKRFAKSIGITQSDDGTDREPAGGEMKLIIAERERDIWKQVAMGLMQK